MNTTENENEFIRLKGVAIAACAWNGYKVDGQGFIHVLGDVESEFLDVVQFEFVPEFDATKVMNPWYGCKTARMVAAYNPKREVVICFIRHGEGDATTVHAYKIKTTPAPPDAAQE